MIKHHPNINILAEYAAGTLEMAPGIAVAAHLHYCPQCRHQVQLLTQLGGALLESQEPQAVKEDELDAIFARIDSEEGRTESRSAPIELPEISKRLHREVPPVIAKLVRRPSDLNWSRLSPSVQTARLTTGQSQFEATLIKTKAGGKTLEHDHRGNEFTVVLKGAFSDHKSIYEQGDFIHCRPGDVHTPSATADADCLCLAVVDAPLKFTGWIGKVINPFMRIQAQ